MSTPTPGWYPDPQTPAQLRWWDGTRWTEHSRPLPNGGPPAPSPGPARAQVTQAAQGSTAPSSSVPSQGPTPALAVQEDPAAKKPWFRRTWVLVTAGVVVFLVVFGAVAGLGDSGDEAAPGGTPAASTVAEESASDRIEVPDVGGMSLADAVAALEAVGLTSDTIGDAGEVESQSPSSGVEVEPGTQVMLTVVDHAAQEAAEAAAQAEAEAAAAAAEAAKGTLSQQNAYRAAQSYLSYTAFSRAGLIDQLTSEYGEGYPPEDAEFAVARLEAEGGVDWNAEAAEAAASYLEYSAFSRQGLLEQLTSEYGEQFTPEQAEYGVSTTGL
ncbi:Ltp family lipoprotein [Cellulomonas fimi]|uniref:Ltp family lipoprotein n=1 Tax=Cellulomonas sp. RIT-PI-Y TaxID=3035297 RepID=UPI0021DB7D89